MHQWLVYRVALISYKVVTTSTPSYLNDLLAVHIPPDQLIDNPLLLFLTSHLTSPDNPSALSHQPYGTRCLMVYSLVCRKQLSS